MRLSFLNFFRKENTEVVSISQDKLVLRMNRLLASEDRVPLRELLQVMEVCFTQAILSIVYGEERSIIATTGSRDTLSDIENVAYRIKDTENKEYYLRSEVNGLYFRKGMHCIRIFPFSKVTNEPCFLMVEQESVTGGDMNIDRVIDFLSIAVRLKVLTEKKNDSRINEGELLNRDAFLECLRSTDTEQGEEKNYIGVFHFANMGELNMKIGAKGIDDIIDGITSMLKTTFPASVCRISTSKFAVILRGEMYYTVCALQDMLDEISDKFPKAKIKCVTTMVTDDIYRIMYLCEKASETTIGDAVVLIREGDESFDDDNVEETTYYQADEPEIIDDISYKEVEIEPEEMESAMKDFAEAKERKKSEMNAQRKVAGEQRERKKSSFFEYGASSFDYQAQFNDVKEG